MFELSENSIIKIIRHFPLIRHDLLKEIKNIVNRELHYNKRLPGMKNEHLGTTGLCSMISGKVFDLLKNNYNLELKSGYFLLDHHPRFKNNEKIYTRHSWIEIDDKILDLTANQFNPFVNTIYDNIHITPKNDPRYQTRNLPEFIDVGIDDNNEDYILNWYIKHI